LFVDRNLDVVATELPHAVISSTAGIVARPKGNTVAMLSKKR
jgi:Zn-dependent metalloprotease